MTLLRFIRITAVFLVLVAQSALAGRVELYAEPGVQHRLWGPLVRELAEGDTLAFSNGKEFTFETELGRGETTVILGVKEEGRAIRLPLKTGYFRSLYPYKEYLRFFLQGYEQLKNSEVPIVQVFPGESDPREYLLVERVPVLYTLDKFIERSHLMKPEGRRAPLRALHEFATRTWQYAEIGDFRPDQLAWTGSRWVLLDFINEVREYPFDPTKTVFDAPGFQALRRSLKQTVFDRRTTADPSLCEKLLMSSRSRG